MANTNSKTAVKAVFVANRGLFLRQLVPVILALLGGVQFYEHIVALDFSLIGATFDQVMPTQWGLAIAFTGISYWAIGRYDWLIHSMLDTGISPQTAKKSGAASIAIAQFAGFGVLTGTLVRWRMLPEFSLAQSLQVSVWVSATFLAGWAGITAMALLTSGPKLGTYTVWPLAVLFVLFTLVILSVWQPKISVSFPSLRLIATVLFLVAIDLICAGFCLYVLLPNEINVAPLQFFSIFLLSFGAGLVAGTPGGIGPFELTMIALLPFTTSEPLLASILAYRLIYFALPASVATIALFRGRLNSDNSSLTSLSKPIRSAYLSPELEKCLWQSDWAEANLLRQGDFGCMTRNTHPTAIAAPLGQTLVLLGAPLNNPAISDFLSQFKRLAKDKTRSAMIYKCPPRLALAARNLGWKALPIVREAWIKPAEFSISAPARRQLRRFVRKAENAGIEISEGSRELPFSEMRAISDQWSLNHAGERGFSMGTFDVDYINCQRVFLAHFEGSLVAFLTLHETQKEWTVDIMRCSGDTPVGTMHSLICAAIKCADENRIARLSLASVPHQFTNDSRFTEKLRNQISTSANAEGLMRFKSSFAPHWRVLYAVAPSKISIFIGLIEVLHAIRQRKHRNDEIS